MLLKVLATVFIGVGLGLVLFSAKYVDGKTKREIAKDNLCAMTDEQRKKEIFKTRSKGILFALFGGAMWAVAIVFL